MLISLLSLLEFTEPKKGQNKPPTLLESFLRCGFIEPKGGGPIYTTNALVCFFYKQFNKFDLINFFCTSPSILSLTNDFCH